MRSEHGGAALPVFEFTGGRLSLDFANTVDNRSAERRRDLLGGYPDLVAWACQAGLLLDSEARRLRSLVTRRARESARVLERAKTLRESLYSVFSALAAKEEAPAADLAVFGEGLSEALRQARVIRGPAGFSWGWDPAPGALDRMLWPVVRDAADVLTSDRLPRLRECAADDCGWLFLDESRNRSRVWCNMRVCGNRAKARRHYARATRGRRSDREGAWG